MRPSFIQVLYRVARWYLISHNITATDYSLKLKCITPYGSFVSWFKCRSEQQKNHYHLSLFIRTMFLFIIYFCFALTPVNYSGDSLHATGHEDFNTGPVFLCPLVADTGTSFTSYCNWSWKLSSVQTEMLNGVIYYVTCQQISAV